MSRIRVLGPRDSLEEVLATLQDEGTVHLIAARALGPLRAPEPDLRTTRRTQHLRRLLEDLEAVVPSAPRGMAVAAPVADADLPHAARQARRQREREKHTRLRLLFRRPGDPAEEAHRINGSG